MRSRIAGAVLALLSTAGCAGIPRPLAPPMPVIPSLGLLFEKYRAPLQINVSEDRIGSKIGTARVRLIQDPIFTGQPLLTWGDTPQDMAIVKAARNGGIQTIRHIDYERFSVLSTYVELKIIVYGD